MRDDLDRTNYERPKRERKSRINWWVVTKICLYIIILGVSVWGWNKIVNTGYGLAKNYVDTAIEQVRQENALNIQELTDQMDQLSNEMTSLRDAVENTDETLSGSTNIQQDIEKRLQDLDSQLEDLERSLKILREAP